MKPRWIAAAAFALGVAGCDNYITRPEQTIFLLTQVDSKTLPVALVGAQGTTATVTYGVLVGAANTTQCEFTLQVEAAANIYRPKGLVPDCSISKGGRILIRIDLGSPLVAETHDYLFEY